MMDTGPFSKFWGAGGPSIETMRQSRPWSEDVSSAKSLNWITAGGDGAAFDHC